MNNVKQRTIINFFSVEKATTIRHFYWFRSTLAGMCCAGIPILLFSTLLIFSTLLSSCSKYAVTFNNQVMYSPPPLLREIQVNDKKLRTCIEQTVSDGGITAASQLKRLSCTHAGISALEGIEQFDQLENLNLANNQLTELTPLSKLSQLTVLNVRENRLTDVSALLSLIHLEKADVGDNPDLACTDLEQLAKSFEGELTLPKQCER